MTERPWSDPGGDPLADIQAMMARLTSREYQQAFARRQYEEARDRVALFDELERRVALQAQERGVEKAVIYDEIYQALPDALKLGLFGWAL